MIGIVSNQHQVEEALVVTVEAHSSHICLCTSRQVYKLYPQDHSMKTRKEKKTLSSHMDSEIMFSASLKPLPEL